MFKFFGFPSVSHAEIIQIAIISENRLTVIPKTLDLKMAALFGCAVTSAFGAVNNDAKVKIGQSVLIFGIGGMGINIAYAKFIPTKKNSQTKNFYDDIGFKIIEENKDVIRTYSYKLNKTLEIEKYYKFIK